MKVKEGDIVFGVQIRFDGRGQILLGTNKQLGRHGMHFCRRCMSVLPVADFNKGQNICRACWRVDPTRVKNSRRNSIKFLQRRLYDKVKLIEMLGGRCARCGCSDKHPYSYHCHHVPQEQKQFNISEKLGVFDFFRRFRPEIEKCALLCSDCHQTLNLTWSGRFRKRKNGVGYELGAIKEYNYDGDIQPAHGGD